MSAGLSAGCAKGSGSKQSFCRELGSLPQPEQFFRGFNPASTEAVASADRRTSEELQKLERAAPQQIKPDVSAVADLQADIADVVKRYGSNRRTLQAKLIELGQQRLGAASSAVKVGDYARHQCGINLSGRSSVRGSDTGTAQASDGSDTSSPPATDLSSAPDSSS